MARTPRKKSTVTATYVPDSPFFDEVLDWSRYSERQRADVHKRFPLLLIDRSPHGWGCFARQNIPAGVFVCPVEGRIVADMDYGSNRCFNLGRPWGVIEPMPPAAYLNHSCEPNCGQVLFPQAEGPPMLVLVTTKPVSQGVELTHDYHWKSDVKCLCGSKTCRGYI